MDSRMRAGYTNLEVDMNVEQVEVSSVNTHAFAAFPKTSRRGEEPREVLEHVLGLLEDFGPTWYTEELHNRIVAALTSREM